MSDTATKRPPTPEEIRARREEILGIAARHGASNVRLFGSVARGDTDGAGDIHFLVDMQPGRSLFDMGGLLMDLTDLLDCDVDVVTPKSLRERIRKRVLADATVL